ncbi:hypothetical protein Taro_022842 [Colocasia esculenta]|uniref:Uncharacterized protein n=1 Tax=Colocasia esculenta TaxID=4460 RepID=A0A843V2Z6_COLES|nr:hypothetical protein [Colocasia esculenta]
MNATCVKATCQVSRSPEAPARATRGLAPVGLSEVLSELLRRQRVGVSRSCWERDRDLVAFSGGGGLPPAIRRCGVAGSSCGAAARAWSEEEAANQCEGPFVGWFLRSKGSACDRDRVAVAIPVWRRRATCRLRVATGWPSRSPLPFSFEFCSEGGTLAVAFGVATGQSSRSTFWGSDDALVAFSPLCRLAAGQWPRLSVVARRVRAVAARLALDSLVVVFLVWRTLASQSKCGALRAVLHRWSSAATLVCGRCQPGADWLRALAEVHRLVALCSGGGFPELFVVVLSGALVVLVEDRPLSLLAEVLPRSALCLFRATVVLPLRFEVFRLVGLHSGEVLPGWLLGLLVEFAWALSVKGSCPWLCVWLLRWPACLVSHSGLVSAVGVWLAVLLVEASVLHCGFPSRAWKRLVACVSPSSTFVGLLKVVMLHCGVVSSRCASVGASCFGVIFGADMVVALLKKLSASRVLLLWVSGGESPSVGPVLSWAGGAVACAALSAFLRCIMSLCLKGAGVGMACCALSGLRFFVCGFRLTPPYFLQLGARRRGSSVSDGLRRRLWRRVVVSSSESERFYIALACLGLAPDDLPYPARSWKLQLLDYLQPDGPLGSNRYPIEPEQGGGDRFELGTQVSHFKETIIEQDVGRSPIVNKDTVYRVAIDVDMDDQNSNGIVPYL